MEKEKIVQKCRKVFIPIAANRIFSDGGGSGGEYDFVQVFRKEDDALRTVAAKHEYAYLKHKREPVKQEVCAFYLVPAKAIE